MKKLIFWILIAYAAPCYLHAQWQDTNWWWAYFGPLSPYYASTTMSFSSSSGEPTFTAGPPFGSSDGSSLSASDREGNLVFFTDGFRVFNKNYEIMDNGDSLNFGYHWVNTVQYNSSYSTYPNLIFIPFNDSIYYLIHARARIGECDYVITHADLLYSKIDIYANNGLGRVLEKNVLIKSCEDGSWRATGAVKHANGRDWWVVSSYLNKEDYHIFKISNLGVSEGNTVYSEPTNIDFISHGRLLFTPDGTRMISSAPNASARIHDFDRCTGQIGDFQEIPTLFQNTWNYESLGDGAAVSPNSRYLYLTSNSFVAQYDLHSPNIAATADTVMVYDGYNTTEYPIPCKFGMMELAANGKMYVSINALSGPNFLHPINFPNRPGKSCKAKQRGLSIPIGASRCFTLSPNYRLGPIDGSSCDTLGIDNMPLAHFRWEVEDSVQYRAVTFTDNSFYEPATWSWTFGDGNVSQDTSPVHTYAADGLYNACLTVSNANGSHTTCREVLVNQLISEVVTPSEVTFGATLHPNPTSADTWVSLSGARGSVRYTCYDALGRSVSAGTLGEQGGNVSLGGQSRGVYHLHLLDEAGQSAVLRVLKE
jgi:PKD repeat protein